MCWGRREGGREEAREGARDRGRGVWVSSGGLPAADGRRSRSIDALEGSLLIKE